MFFITDDIIMVAKSESFIATFSIVIIITGTAVIRSGSARRLKRLQCGP